MPTYHVPIPQYVHADLERVLARIEQDLPNGHRIDSIRATIHTTPSGNRTWRLTIVVSAR